MKKKTQNGFKIMRRQSLAHLLLIHTNTMYDFVGNFTEEFLKSSNEWLNDNVIIPYYIFLKKVVSSEELYSSIKSGKIEFNFEKMFYLHQLFSELFRVVRKMPLLGRYYKDKHNALASSFI